MSWGGWGTSRPRVNTGPCAANGCDKPAVCRGFCNQHYSRQRIYGDANKPYMNKAPAGSTINTSHGYCTIRVNGKPKYEHVIVAERALGKPLPAGAIIHHINEIKADNRPENLVICPSRAYHILIHQRMAALAATGNPNLIKCCYCHQWDTPVAVPERTDGHRSRYHKKCSSDYLRRRRQEKNRALQML